MASSMGNQQKLLENLESTNRSLADRSIDDDFELVSDAQLIEPISILSEYESRRDGENDDDVGNRGSTATMLDDVGGGDEENRIHVIDPLSAFEMIHSEHRLLKDELENQNEILRARLEMTEIQERQKAEELASQKRLVESLSLKLNETKIQQEELENQNGFLRERMEMAEKQEREKLEQLVTLQSTVESLSNELNEKKEEELERQNSNSSEKPVGFDAEQIVKINEWTDHLTARLLEAEEVVKSQHTLIQQLQSDGYGGAAPTIRAPALSTDASLTAELEQKKEQIKRMESSLASVESALSTKHGEHLKTKREAEDMAEMNRELQGIIMELQSQAEADKTKNDADKAEWEAIRGDLEKQIQFLSDRVIAFENQFSGVSINQAPNNAAAAAAAASSLDDSQSGTQQHGGGSRWIECHRCHLPMIRDGPHPGCPSIIDGLD